MIYWCKEDLFETGRKYIMPQRVSVKRAEQEKERKKEIKMNNRRLRNKAKQKKENKK